MIENHIHLIPVTDIHVARESRQRTDLTPDSVLELAVSIGSNGWIAPILVSQDDMHIIAGERRYTAVSLLQKAAAGDYSLFSKPDEAKLRLAPVAKCRHKSWENWTKIPGQFGSNLTQLDKSLLELIENLHRKDLQWQDQAKACYELHESYLRKALSLDVKWSIADTAECIGLSNEMTNRYIKAWREGLTGDATLSAIVAEADSINKASKAIDRIKSRRTDPITLNTPKTVKTSKDEAEPEPINPANPAEDMLFNADFHQFASQYEGAPFNFIHCDFPYGIKYNVGAGQGTAVDTLLMGDYDDSPDVYWELLETFTKYRESLVAPSAHIMFWFSQNFRRETEDFFKSRWPDATIQPHLMIWHCSDNSGIVPDTQRYGRRTYETAMLITVGDRKIVQPKALSVGVPRSGSRIHRSQKPIEMLSHFFSMFVDDSSLVLDPTCGSGTSLITAHRMKAKAILGLERNPAMFESAREYINQELKPCLKL